MSPSALPLIAEPDYASFQRMIPELLHVTYDEWADEHQKSIAYRRSRNGHREIPISPNGFAQWLNENNQTAHMELLWVYAEDQAAEMVQPAYNVSSRNDGKSPTPAK